MKLSDIIAKIQKGEALTAEEITFLQNIKPLDHDSVKEYLEKDETGKKLLTSLTDSAVTKGINTFKDKTLPGLIDEEVKKKNPELTEDQKKIQQLANDLESMKSEANKAKLKNSAITLGTGKKIPIKLIDFLIGSDEDSTNANIELFATEYTNSIASAVQEQFKTNGRKPDGGGSGTEPNLDDLSDTEYMAKRLTK